MKRFIFAFLITFTHFYAFAQMTTPPTSSEKAYFRNINELKNPGFELGRTGWTLSTGSLVSVTAAANIDYGGARSVSWDASAASQTMTSDALSITSGGGYSLTNVVASCRFKASTGTATHVLQVYDGTNVLAASTITSSTSNFIRTTAPPVAAPASGSLYLRIVSSADEPLTYIDNCFLGAADGFNVGSWSTAELYGAIKYAGATNCQWTTGDTGAALTDFGADTDCSTPTTYANASAPSTKVPRIKFASLPPGNYMVVISYIGSAGTLGTSATGLFRIYDGTTNSSERFFEVNSGAQVTPAADPLIGFFTYTTAQTNIEFRPRALSSTNTNDPYILNDNTNRDFEIQVYRFPTASEIAYRPDQIAWRVDANISGANPSLGTSDQASYVGIEDTGLTLTNNSGANVLTAQIPCSSTNSPTGTTCSAGSESVGVSFTMPTAGDVLACASFSIEISTGAGGQDNGAFQIVETPTNAQTISQEGKSRVGFTNRTANTTLNQPFRVCGTFSFASAGQKVLRLMYEQDATATLSSAIVLADALSTIGQRDIHWEVYPLGTLFGAPLLVNSVTNSSSGVTRTEVARLNCDSAASIVSQHGNWVSSIGNVSSNNCTVTLTTGTFSSTPYCTATWFDSSAGTSIVAVTPSSATSLVIKAVTDANADDANFDVTLQCTGAR